VESYAESLDTTWILREPVIRSAIRALQFAPGSHGLDVGCGIGNITTMLARSVGLNGHVTGVDISPDMVADAQHLTQNAGLNNLLTFRQGDMWGLPFDDDTFDWVWSADCVGYAPLNPLPLIEELVRVTKPGGKIAISAWSSEKLLPGYPILEARLNATSAGIAPFRVGKNPETHFLRTLGWFQRLSLQAATSQTLAGSAYAPLSQEIREALVSLIEMRWPDVEAELDPEDWGIFQRLCPPTSPDYILDVPDYYAFFTYTLFQAIVPMT